jgi:poly-gamma-glutamate synthesis protein (capsule biosynthesis protein)
VRNARKEHDIVLVSYHGGREYAELPAKEPTLIARIAMEAGADAVLAHHPHVPQGIGWADGRPIFCSLGNLVFGKHRAYAWTGQSYLARLSFEEGRLPEVAVCPYFIERNLPLPASESVGSGWDALFRRYVRRTSSYASVGGTTVGAADAGGCLPIHPGMPAG